MQTNQYLQQNEPWNVIKLGTETGQAKVDRTIYYCSEAIRIVGILLQPYMPSKAAVLLDMMGVDESRRTFEDAVIGADDTYGDAKVPIGKGTFDGLFPPLPVED